jgi:hypothetical protein
MILGIGVTKMKDKKVIFNRTAHVAQWDWLSQHPDKSVTDWPGWANKGGKFKLTFSGCFMCPCALIRRDNAHSTDGICRFCPMDWGNKKYCSSECCNGKSNFLFDKYYYAHSLKKKSLYAAQIRDLPVKEDVICV